MPNLTVTLILVTFLDASGTTSFTKTSFAIPLGMTLVLPAFSALFWAATNLLVVLICCHDTLNVFISEVKIVSRVLSSVSLSPWSCFWLGGRLTCQF